MTFAPRFSAAMPDVIPVSAARSRSDLPVQSFGNVLYLPAARRVRFAHWFAPAFAGFLRDRFATPEEVAAAFGVRASTAWNWWNGDNRASGDAVARLFMTFPEAAQWFADDWSAQR